ncbi:hypothetical protein DBR43_10000 [Pedobacter sp. KBW06]|uniref:CHRD domain-containing protein n=1 Tax=Pedobacter sp. KBW06 TaxID=2153359 RepID=UPI000F590A65|nr:CHRD domain-containing protein [Pedobacter sp. KBW06]RQO75660.1 hypothetical protein DBR43_10000 [Pedobacter sp. KBW06]
MLTKRLTQLKGISLKRSVLLLSTAFCMFVIFSSCKKKSNPPIPVKVPTEYTFTGPINAILAQTGSSAIGIFSATYITATKTLNYNIFFNGLDPENINLHQGNSSIPGSLIANLKKTGTAYVSPLLGSVVLNDQSEKELLNGNLYVNMTSVKFPAGEIRGKIFLIKN